MRKLGRSKWISGRVVASLAGLAVVGAMSPVHAQTGERTGKQLVDSLCISCHGTGAGGKLNTRRILRTEKVSMQRAVARLY